VVELSSEEMSVGLGEQGTSREVRRGRPRVRGERNPSSLEERLCEGRKVDSTPTSPLSRGVETSVIMIEGIFSW